MSGGRFLVNLTEVSTSEKNWHADPCSKWETITGYKKNLNTQARGDYVVAFVQKLELDESAIIEASLCDNSKFVAFNTKKFQIENYMPIMLYSDDVP